MQEALQQLGKIAKDFTDAVQVVQVFGRAFKALCTVDIYIVILVILILLKLVTYKRKQSAVVPNWRKVIPGLNLEGTCTNPQCEAYQFTDVLCCIGMGKQDFGRLSATSKCPCCSKRLRKVNNMHFSNCKFSYEGETQEGRFI